VLLVQPYHDALDPETACSAEYNFAQRMHENVVRSRDEWRVSTDPLRLWWTTAFRRALQVESRP
jgi:hypothetical protein